MLITIDTELFKAKMKEAMEKERIESKGRMTKAQEENGREGGMAGLIMEMTIMVGISKGVAAAESVIKEIGVEVKQPTINL